MNFGPARLDRVARRLALFFPFGISVAASNAPSANREVDFDPDEHVDRHGPKASRIEPPQGDGRNGFFIEAQLQRSDDPHFRRASVVRDATSSATVPWILFKSASLVYLGLTSLISRGADTDPPAR
jgi:hypothetical protein